MASDDSARGEDLNDDDDDDDDDQDEDEEDGDEIRPVSVLTSSAFCCLILDSRAPLRVAKPPGEMTSFG